MPKVSVIIPAYNCERTIAATVDSVLAQTYRDFELIVVDDGSTDGTAAILRGYGSRLTYVYQPNRERAAARNNGIRHATGEYLAFLDADDAWLPHKLERQVEALDRNPHAGLVYSQAYRVDDSGRPLPGVVGRGSAARRIFSDLVLYKAIVPTATATVRACCLEQVGSFDESLIYLEDWELWLRLSLAYDVLFIAEPLARYRVSDPVTVLGKLDRCGFANSLIAVTERTFANLPPGDSERARLRVKALGAAYALIAHHCVTGGARRRAAHYLMQAARSAPSVFASRIFLGTALRCVVGNRLMQ